MFTCASCSEEHSDGTVCSVCKQHFDFQCSGITENGYRKLGQRKNSWRCPACKGSPLPLSTVSTQLPEQLKKMQGQLNKIMDQLLPLEPIAANMQTIVSDINTLNDSVELAHEQIDSFSGMVNDFEIRSLEMEQTRSDVHVLEAEIRRLNIELHDRDQWIRNNNVEIRGIPQTTNEDLYDIAIKIGKISDFNLRKEEINYTARIPTRVSNVDKPIIVSFVNRYIKENFIAAARASENQDIEYLGFAEEGTFYVNDHLSARNKMLLLKAKNLAKENNFDYIWVKHGRIMARKSKNSDFFYIRNENDLEKIV